MRKARQYVFALVGAFILMSGAVRAQGEEPNSLRAMTVGQHGGGVVVKLTFKEALSALPPGFSIAKPARIALDFAKTVNGMGKNAQTYNEGDLRSVNVVQTEERMRLVLNLNQAMSYEAGIDGKNLLLTLTPSARKDELAAPAEHFSQAKASFSSNSIRDIAFRRGRDGEARITVDLSNTNAGIDIRQQGQTLLVDFVKVSVPAALLKQLDVTDFATPVVSFATTQQGANARISITPRGLWEHNAYQTDNQFVIEIKPVVENPNKLVQGTRGGYQGEKLSLNFQNVEVRRLLQVIGEFTGMNMVVSDSVSGSITLILKEVPWDQALDIILLQKGLDMRKNGNVILIAPREEIATKEKLEFEAKAQIGDLEPLRTESFQLNYQKAEEIKKLLSDTGQRLLSKRGSAMVDARTNILFVQDTPSRLDDVRQLIAKVDIAARQVMIEARIVEAGDSFAKNLGIRLGTGATTRTTDSATGSTTISNSATLAAINTTTRTSQMGAVNLPADPRSGKAGTFALSLYNSDYTRYLSAEISALEADGKLKIISSPRVMTANQSEAIIESGVEIPYQQATSSGATSVTFRKANLALKVKPQIAPDGKISMTLDINKDKPNQTLSVTGGIPIDTNHIKTEVLVDNGGTVVIGGIYTQTVSNSTQRIPFFGDLPYIGWLFKNREWIDDKNELLIFITPKIVADSLSVR